MDVQTSKGRKSKNLGRQKQSVSRNDDNVGIQLNQLCSRRLIAPKRGGLKHRDSALQSQSFDGRFRHLTASTCPTVPSSVHSNYLVTLVRQGIQNGESDVGRPHEHDSDFARLSEVAHQVAPLPENPSNDTWPPTFIPNSEIVPALVSSTYVGWLIDQ